MSDIISDCGMYTLFMYDAALLYKFIYTWSVNYLREKKGTFLLELVLVPMILSCSLRCSSLDFTHGYIFYCLSVHLICHCVFFGWFYTIFDIFPRYYFYALLSFFLIRRYTCWRTKLCGYSRRAFTWGQYATLIISFPIHLYIHNSFVCPSLFNFMQSTGWSLGSQYCRKACSTPSKFSWRLR